MAANTATPKLSAVFTNYNDAAILPDLVAKAKDICQKITDQFEIIIVDDASRDNSRDVLKQLAHKEPKLKAVFLSRNFGQQLAMSAGIAQAKGQSVFIADGDLQNPIEEMPRLNEEINKGADIVYAVSKDRAKFTSIMTSRMFWFVMKRILKVDMVPNQLMMRMMSRSFVDKYNMYPERLRLVADICHDVGMKKAVVEVTNHNRQSGKSNYNFFKRLHLFVNSILLSTTKPLSILMYMGLLLTALSVILITESIVRYFLLDITPGFTTLVSIITFFGSVLIFMTGIIGQYLANIYIEVRRRPSYHVEEVIQYGNA